MSRNGYENRGPSLSIAHVYLTLRFSIPPEKSDETLPQALAPECDGTFQRHPPPWTLPPLVTPSPPLNLRPDPILDIPRLSPNLKHLSHTLQPIRILQAGLRWRRRRCSTPRELTTLSDSLRDLLRFPEVHGASRHLPRT